MSPRRWLLACDLDQTLIYSRNAFRLPPDAAPEELVTVEYLDGEPLSYLTRRAAEGLRELARAATLVPVTTRTLEQYQRVQLGIPCPYAIAANGGHLLLGGTPDPDWTRRVRTRLAASGRSLEHVRALADELAAAGSWVRTIRDADGFFVYLVAHQRELIPDLSALATRLESDGWTLSIQGRKVYFVPTALTKEAALEELLARTGAPQLVAAGDSLLDRGMLARAAVAIRPAHGELHDQGFLSAGMHVTARAGVLGGEDVVDLLAGIVAGSESEAGARLGSATSTDVKASFPVRAG
ncbi:MAG TPA: sucrose-6-phosphate hydrolase [Frankiaceae bacterium]|nr:sucrose-6-phosphate hydrolase [Frankiaceae bacterium]